MTIFYVSLHPMKVKLFISLLACIIYTMAAYPQARIILPDSSQITTNPDSLDLLPRKVESDKQPAQSSHLDHLLNDHGAMADSLQRIARMTVWTVEARTGNRLLAIPDTLLHNYQQTTLPDGESVAMGFLAPIGSPSISKIFSTAPPKPGILYLTMLTTTI